MNYLLTVLIFAPLAAAGVMLSLPASKTKTYRWVALVTMMLEAVMALALVQSFDPNLRGYGAESLQFVTQCDWIALRLGSWSHFTIQYYVGVDGLSISLVLLSVIVLLIGIIASWRITQQAKGYFILYMALSTSVIGCFVALDLFLFFLFFEFMLLPMYFLIGIWGGQRRAYASMKFFIYTFVGSLLILMVMIGLSLSVVDTPNGSVHTFDMMKMMHPSHYLHDAALGFGEAGLFLGLPYRTWAFFLFMLGFAIKLPIVPVHTWLPDAHVEAPTSISVVLAGVLLKIGGYGLYRIGYGIFPESAWAYGYWIALFGVVSIVYAAFVAMAQADLKRLIAYSSVSHMGFVVLGMASLTMEGMAGAWFQMFSHGILSPLLFLMAGVLYDRTGDRTIAHYSGLGNKMPYFTTAVVISFFAALGLPGFSGFIAEFLVLLGAFEDVAHGSILALYMPMLGLLGLLLGAGYFLWTIQRMFFGPFWVKDVHKSLPDLTPREWAMIAPLVLLALYLGIFPGGLLHLSNETIIGFIDFVHTQGKQNMELINALTP